MRPSVVIWTCLDKAPAKADWIQLQEELKGTFWPKSSQDPNACGIILQCSIRQKEELNILLRFVEAKGSLPTVSELWDETMSWVSESP